MQGMVGRTVGGEGMTALDSLLDAMIARDR